MRRGQLWEERKALEGENSVARVFQSLEEARGAAAE